MIADYIWVAMSGMIAAIVLAILLMVRMSLRHRRAFRDAAEELGLTWSSKGFLRAGRVKGTLHDIPVRVLSSFQGKGSLERSITVVEARFDPELPVELHVGRENVLSRMAHNLGVHDVEFGDERFDAVYLVRGKDPAVLEKVLDEESRLGLVVLSRDADDLHVDATRVRWVQSGRVVDGAVLVRALKAAALTAQSLQRSANA